MNAQITGLVFSLGAMQVARKIPTDDPEVLVWLRIGYVLIQAATVATYFYISLKIKQKNDTSVLKYQKPASPLSQTGPELVTTTVRDYDLEQTNQASRGVYISCAIMCFLHLYMKYTQPLFIQSVMALKAMYDSKVFKLHVLGQAPVGDLKRPFAAAPSMMDAFTGGAGATDPATIKEAEKNETKKTK